ncbi:MULTISPECIES: LLM class flavin-dependent oxidoreductase [unclassified Nocardioides]|uniref:LLM class flavin-dependent oxidoreductase n=1 Tax=unclassified Nocardioides TaxID=2615069 RepID=UPI000703A126|nr:MULTISPECIES: LLM class flavin-dependent oxidoreductase [unclassified Nocardioides]KRC53535.1 luciferase [Nocardioides sp. Root79]KRC67989.1 luciferase [Nocardioides sp. Root240]
MTDLVFGLDTFGDVTLDPTTGERLDHPQVIRNVVEQAVLADQVGVDVFGIGEHHRADFAVTSPEMVLATIAARTERIRLGTAVTVLSSDDPVRLYERFATLDALSDGRAEITMGRGSFTESFPLFGFDLAHYDQLFSEKIDLWAALQGEQEVTWDRGELRPPLRNARLYPTTERGSIPTWIGVGGSPESVVRAATYGFPLAIAIIGGEPARFAPFTDLYRRALKEFDRPALPIAVHSPGFVADTDEEARESMYPHFQESRNRIGAERGWGPGTRAQYDAEVDDGALFVGAPETVARKIAKAVQDLGIQRFDLKYSNGAMPHPQLLHSIELFGTQVIPRVRELLAEAPVSA